jgi:hypothetical protein
MFVLMNYWWTPPAGAQALLEGAGAGNGGVDPTEQALVARLKEGPSIELTLCRSLPDPWRPLFRHLADALPPGNDP